MAVYERTYRRYEGPTTPERSRFLVVPRYAYQEVFKSRLFVAFLVLCFALPVAGAVMIYLHHNLTALTALGLPAEELKQILPIDAGFFRRGLEMQGFLAFLLTLTVGPALVAPDLRNNGLPLYLSRPFSRSEYVLGKMSVLVILLSAITWVPGLLLFLFQGSLEGAGWMAEQARIAWALFVGSWAWILALSLLALAVSAWVKWKPVARIALLMLYFVAIGFAEAVDGTLDTDWGGILSIWQVITTVWASLFGLEPVFDLPIGAAWSALVAGCLISLWLLSRRVRAYEVVR